MNSSFTETELNNVFLINYVDGPWQNAIHSWETVVFKHGKKTIFSKIVQHGQIYFSVSPSDQSKFRKTHLYNHPYKKIIQEIKWGLDQMWTRITLMVKEGQNEVTLTTTITLVVDISAMDQWYTGYNGLYTGYRSLFLSYSKNQWRRFLFRINEKLLKTKSNKNHNHHTFHCLSSPPTSYHRQQLKTSQNVRVYLW